MKKQNVGFAYLLLGLIVALPYTVYIESFFLYLAGVVLGIIGLRIVISDAKDGMKEDEESSKEE